MEKKRQFYMPTNEKLIIRELPYEESCMDEKKGDDVLNSWVHTFSGEKFFHGYKKIPAGPVTFSYPGDVIWDMHNTIPVGVKDGKPNVNDEEALHTWIGKIGEATLFRIASKTKSTFKDDMVNYLLMLVIFIEIIAWAIRFATGD